MNDAIAYLRTNYLKYANMTNEEVKQVLIDSPYATIGNVLFERPSKYLDRTKGLFKVHETEHSMHIPEEKAQGIDFGKLKPEGKEPDYWERNNNTEIGARVAQVLTAQGIRTARIFTGDSLKQLFIKYLSNNGNPDNEISKLYNAVTNWHKFAKWVNNPKNVYSMVGLVIAGSLIKNNK